MVMLPAGRFRMGSPDSEAGRETDEGPVHEVSIARPFAVGKFEVTRGQFARFVRATGRDMAGCVVFSIEAGKLKLERDPANSWLDPGFAQGDEHPVVCVSFEDAKAYVEWLSAQTGTRYRLLAEAEWEYGARAGSTASRFWGSSDEQACEYANVPDRRLKSRHSRALPFETFDCDDGYAETAPAGRYRANAFGLHDMLGNVSEWVEDCWNESYRGAPVDGSAWLIGNCGKRGIRGGSWTYGLRSVRSAFRGRGELEYRSESLGFRVARTLP